jgi:hypothetical protein
MDANKSTKSTKKDIQQQGMIKKRVKAEKIGLDHPRGKVRFKRVLENIRKKKQS